MHFLHSKTIRLYMKNNLFVSLRFFIQIEEESIWGNLITTFRKIVSPTNLLFFTHLNKTKKRNELIALLWAPFGLFLLENNFLSCYRVSLQKRQFIYKTEALLTKALLLYIKISKVRNCILAIFIFLDIKFGYIYPRKSVRSLMIDLIRTFMMAMKVQISIRYMILTAGKFLLEEMNILIKPIVMIEEIFILKILLMMSGIRKMMSFLQIPQILQMSASQFLSFQLFLEKVLKLTPILISHAAHYPFQISQIQWEIRYIMKKVLLLMIC